MAGTTVVRKLDDLPSPFGRQDNFPLDLTVTDDYDGGRMFSRSTGRRAVTPLFIVLLAIGSSDLLFALDSIPAIFGVTDEAYIVIAANAFALLGLRPQAVANVKAKG